MVKYDRDRIIQDADSYTVASQIGMRLKRAGSRWQIICPCHADRNFGSAYLTPHGFVCYACGSKGNVIDLVMHHEGTSFREAIETVADICGNSEDYLVEEDDPRYDDPDPDSDQEEDAAESDGKTADKKTSKAKRIPCLKSEEAKLIGINSSYFKESYPKAVFSEDPTELVKLARFPRYNDLLEERRKYLRTVPSAEIRKQWMGLTFKEKEVSLSEEAATPLKALYQIELKMQEMYHQFSEHEKKLWSVRCDDEGRAAFIREINKALDLGEIPDIRNESTMCDGKWVNEYLVPEKSSKGDYLVNLYKSDYQSYVCLIVRMAKDALKKHQKLLNLLESSATRFNVELAYIEDERIEKIKVILKSHQDQIEDQRMKRAD